MKLILLLLLAGGWALVASSAVPADKAYVKKQKDILLLLKYINQPSNEKDCVNIGTTYSISQNQDRYTNKEAVQEFIQYYKYGMLPRGDIFSVFYEDHLRQAIALFKLLYFAQDYETFYNTAAWARQNVNEGMFVYSFMVAVIRRQDTGRLVLPPIYEIYPHYFINSEVIQKAYKYKQLHTGKSVQDGGYNGYTIESNFSGHYLNLHPEQSLSYYLEDVGINAFYYYFNIYYPFWMCGKQYGIQDVNRGEQYYFLHQQLLARYYLERISYGFGEIPYINWDVPVETAYYSSLQYPNGLDFPSRPPFADLHEYYRLYGQSWSMKGPFGYALTLVKDYQRRINDAMDSRYVYSDEGKVDLKTPDAINIIGNLLQSNLDSPNYKYYGAIWLFASQLLGYSRTPLDINKVVPSALEHFETCLRDPVFYQMYKKILLNVQRFYANIPSYTEKDLVFPGVQIKKFSVDRLVTFYDYFYIDLNNAVYFSPEEQLQNNFNVRARQYRLNNKPFTYKITVQSEKETKAVVKVFLGPKYDEYGRYINVTENRLNMALMDYFVYNLKAGENVISCNSYDIFGFGADPTSYSDLYKQATGAPDRQQSTQVDKQNYYFYPRRYILPKGSYDGVPYQFYVIIYPYVPKATPINKVHESYYYPFEGDQQFYDSYSLGYPFDRFIRFEKLWYDIPNSFWYEAKVFHRDYNINVVQTD